MDQECRQIHRSKLPPRWLKSHKCRTLVCSRQFLKKRKSSSSFSMSTSRASLRKSMISAWVSCTKDWTKRHRWTHRSYCSTTWPRNHFLPIIKGQAIANCWNRGLVGSEPSNWANRCNYKRRSLVVLKIIASPSLRRLRAPQFCSKIETGLVVAMTIKITARKRRRKARRLTTTSSTLTTHKKLSTWW